MLLNPLSLVLIETYWNVNVKIPPVKRGRSDVLIETYWNVNIYFRGMHIFKVFSINRNILECKYGKDPYKIQGVEGINRNILECKFVRVHVRQARVRY